MIDLVFVLDGIRRVRPPAPPCARTLAERASHVVATYRAASGGAAADVVTLRGDAIAACLEAAYVRHGDRARWVLEAEHLGAEAKEAWR